MTILSLLLRPFGFRAYTLTCCVSGDCWAFLARPERLPSALSRLPVFGGLLPATAHALAYGVSRGRLAAYGCYELRAGL